MDAKPINSVEPAPIQDPVKVASMPGVYAPLPCVTCGATGLVTHPHPPQALTGAKVDCPTCGGRGETLEIVPFARLSTALAPAK